MEIISKETTTQSSSEVLTHLQALLSEFLEKHPNMTINGLSKRCSVSEPTLRRIKNGQVKTLPSVTTIVDILSYISKEKTIVRLVEKYPGPIADFLKEKIPQTNNSKTPEYSELLNRTLKDPVKYIIYKLAANDTGVDLEKIVEFFGRYGENHLDELLQQNLVEQRGDRYFAKIENFVLSHDLFVSHFKTVADFIKPHKLITASKSHSPLFANYSGSLNKKAYSTILNIQRAAFKKIISVLVDEKSSGEIPTFIIGAVDTLDSKSADEFN